LEIEGWLLDAYAGSAGEMVVWIKKADGGVVRLTDLWYNAIYVSADKESDLEELSQKREIQPFVHSSSFVKKREHVFDYEEKQVLKMVLNRANEAERLAKTIEKSAEFGRYRIYNADLLPAQVYFIEKDLFPLAKVRATEEMGTIRWGLLDSNMAAEYEVPALRRALLRVGVDSARAIPALTDPIRKVVLTTNQETLEINEGSETDKILSLVRTIAEVDPDLLFVEQGDDFATHYLAERAYVNNISDKLILGRDPVPLKRLTKRGTSYWAYNRVMHTPTSHQLYGRINLDAENFFVYSECGLDGLFEVVRLCRIPIHKGSRASIGKCLSSLQAYIAFKDNLLIPWKPTRAEVPKTGKTLLVGDRGGFIYEPKVGIHGRVGELDFTSLFPFIMKTYNISAETVLCRCCPDSERRVPDVDYNICEKRKGVIPRSMELLLHKRVMYKRLKKETLDPVKARMYASRVEALKMLGVCSFGYLSYRNAKFGLIDCHIAVCAFARKLLLDTARIAERRGFEVVHGIVDSLWLKKEGAKREDYLELCKEIAQEIGLPLSFEGIYRWVAFLPSRMHEGVPVLNRYFGMFEDGTLKLRGIESRRRDTIKLVANCQQEIFRLLGGAENAGELRNAIPEVLKTIRSCVHQIKMGKVPMEDLAIVNRLSKNYNEYTGNTVQASAARQLAEEGMELMAGQAVSYVITKFDSKISSEKVRPMELLDPSVKYDKKRYVELLLRGMSTVLEPLGLDEDTLTRQIRYQPLPQLVLEECIGIGMAR
jgi:DNA polymerase elongation subunit (family B)